MANLSKSKIIAHRQCPKRLWLQINRPDLIKVSATTQVRLDEGNKVGDIARHNYPGGVLIDTLKRAEAIDQTKEAIAKNQTIFEGAFFEEDVLIRADLLFPEDLPARPFLIFPTLLKVHKILLVVSLTCLLFASVFVYH